MPPNARERGTAGNAPPDPATHRLPSMPLTSRGKAPRRRPRSSPSSLSSCFALQFPQPQAPPGQPKKLPSRSVQAEWWKGHCCLLLLCFQPSQGCIQVSDQEQAGFGVIKLPSAIVTVTRSQALEQGLPILRGCCEKSSSSALVGSCRVLLGEGGCGAVLIRHFRVLLTACSLSG